MKEKLTKVKSWIKIHDIEIITFTVIAGTIALAIKVAVTKDDKGNRFPWSSMTEFITNPDEPEYQAMLIDGVERQVAVIGDIGGGENLHMFVTEL